MAPAAWISSVPGWPMMSCNCMVGSRVGLGIGPSCCEANCRKFVVLVAGLTARCAGGVAVKNGWANRNGVDLVWRGVVVLRGIVFFAGAVFFSGSAFLARRLGLLDFLAIESSS